MCVLLVKVRYALGCYYLVVGDFQTAQSQLLKTQEQLEMVKSTCDIVEGELRGYLAACSCVLQTGGSRGGGVGKDPAVALDFYFKKQDFKVGREAGMCLDKCATVSTFFGSV